MRFGSLAPDQPRDEELLAEWRGGKADAFTTLMRRHEDRIFSLALRMLGDRADALDATQDTFISVFRQADKFRGESAFSTWVYRVGINACRDALRKRRRTPAPDEDVAADMPSGGPDVDDQVALRMDVAAALAALPDDYRIAVAMHDLGGVPYEEIATVTKAPIGTVKSRISRGRRMLATALEHAPEAETSKEGL
jgi:RNA polymerase sigma-70 factor, ECF subfamily